MWNLSLLLYRVETQNVAQKLEQRVEWAALAIVACSDCYSISCETL